MNATATPAAEYYRTGKGSHRHLDWWCANSKRSIFTGDVQPIPAAQVKDWEPCEVCCGAEGREHAAKVAAAAAAKAAELCSNPGVVNPQRIQSTCRQCGKPGTVNRSTGRIRAHKPLAG